MKYALIPVLEEVKEVVEEHDWASRYAEGIDPIDLDELWEAFEQLMKVYNTNEGTNHE